MMIDITKVIDALEDQMQDKLALAGGDPGSVFTEDAAMLGDAIILLLQLHNMRQQDGLKGERT